MPAPQRRGATTGQLPRLAEHLKAIQQEFLSFLQGMWFASPGRFGLAPEYPNVTRWDSQPRDFHNHHAVARLMPAKSP
jgi:hypothetical protein